MPRKSLNTILGLALLAGFAYLIYPFIAGRSQMQGFCAGLKIGATQKEIERAVSDRGYRVIFEKEQFGFVHDTRSFGRFLCEVKLSDGRLASAIYVDND
jgi:hypothetical protein